MFITLCTREDKPTLLYRIQWWVGIGISNHESEGRVINPVVSWWMKALPAPLYPCCLSCTHPCAPSPVKTCQLFPPLHNTHPLTLPLYCLLAYQLPAVSATHLFPVYSSCLQCLYQSVFQIIVRTPACFVAHLSVCNSSFWFCPVSIYPCELLPDVQYLYLCLFE